MAKIFTDQGNLEKAADIYRYLLENDPDRKDIFDKLLRINEQIAKKKKKSSDHIISLFREWINLVLKYNNLQKLKRLRKSL
ncbi:MAG: hypothetical protein JJW03_06765 [Desulfosarcina sp.]|nr:hypothetical protein [Desulfobacterales bacterium]